MTGTEVYVGLGSNLGDRAANLAVLRRELAAAGLVITAESALRETEPYGFADQPAFLNQAIAGVWAGTPRELLRAAKAAELKAGRVPGRRWGPRAADADILLFGDVVLDEPDLQIPHAGLRERRFVLEPLAEIAPRLCDPTTGRSMAELLADILSP